MNPGDNLAAVVLILGKSTHNNCQMSNQKHENVIVFIPKLFLGYIMGIMLLTLAWDLIEYVKYKW